MFCYSAFYDAIYACKDYASECERLLQLAAEYGAKSGCWLDVACGTGRHAEFLARHYDVTGLDRDDGMLRQARQRLPEARFVQADMCGADLGQQFEVISCLFSAIGYLSEQQLPQACANFARHLKPGGVLMIEPWLRREMLRPGHVVVDQAEADGAKVVRMARLQVEGRVSICQFHYLVGTDEEIRHEFEEHRLTLFSLDQYRQSLEQAGLRYSWDEQGLTGRGLLIGVKESPG
ncbi:MAG: class I SAM-dependent methyltransferase [Vulcanimicrobiota bacterium]